MVEHFETFLVEDGELWGDTKEGARYKIDQIMKRDGKRTEVTYHDGDELVTMVQSESSKYRDSIAERAKVPTP